MNLLALWLALGVFLISVIALVIVARRNKRWYRVYLANPEMSVEHVYRTFWDRLWLGDWSGVMLFRLENGKVIRIGKHWIIKIEEE